jgi:hypothetical protein
MTGQETGRRIPVGEAAVRVDRLLFDGFRHHNFQISANRQPAGSWQLLSLFLRRRITRTKCKWNDAPSLQRVSTGLGGAERRVSEDQRSDHDRALKILIAVPFVSVHSSDVCVTGRISRLQRRRILQF